MLNLIFIRKVRAIEKEKILSIYKKYVHENKCMQIYIGKLQNIIKVHLPHINKKNHFNCSP